MKTVIFNTYLDFLNRDDKKINGVSQEFSNIHPDYEKHNETNNASWNCSRCSRCSGLEGAAPVENALGPAFVVPIIENIHQRILEAVSKDNALEMETWHTCETTHCRAGWVVHLAGPEGYALEKKTTTEFAAMQIYHKSCPDVPVSPVAFYKKNKEAMHDIHSCAEADKELIK